MRRDGNHGMTGMIGMTPSDASADTVMSYAPIIAAWLQLVLPRVTLKFQPSDHFFDA